jgi:hypothetical protein
LYFCASLLNYNIIIIFVIKQKEDVPAADLSKLAEKYNDPVLIKSCTKHASVITKEPFTHESLLLDKKEYQLSEREKAIAFRDYNYDRKYFPYSRSSVCSVYHRYNYNNNTHSLGSNIGTGNHGMLYSAASSANFTSLSSYNNKQAANFDGRSSSLDFSLANNLPCPSLLNVANKNEHFNYKDSFKTNIKGDVKLDSNQLTSTPNLLKYLNSKEPLVCSALTSGTGQERDIISKLVISTNSADKNSNKEQNKQITSSKLPDNLRDVKVMTLVTNRELIFPSCASKQIFSPNETFGLNEFATDMAKSESSSSSTATTTLIIPAGSKCFIFKTAKGCFLRTPDKKYIPIRGNSILDSIMRAQYSGSTPSSSSTFSPSCSLESLDAANASILQSCSKIPNININSGINQGNELVANYNYNYEAKEMQMPSSSLESHYSTENKINSAEYNNFNDISSFYTNELMSGERVPINNHPINNNRLDQIPSIYNTATIETDKQAYVYSQAKLAPVSLLDSSSNGNSNSNSSSSSTGAYMSDNIFDLYDPQQGQDKTYLNNQMSNNPFSLNFDEQPFDSSTISSNYNQYQSSSHLQSPQIAYQSQLGNEITPVSSMTSNLMMPYQNQLI